MMKSVSELDFPAAENVGDGGRGLEYTHPNRIFGQVHMTKTGGTSLNGELALNYERVCGHKGWSYDAYEVNARMKRWAERTRNDTKANAMDWRKVRDSYTWAQRGKDGGRSQNLASRGRVPSWIGDEIGYHDCDYIIEERNWEFWVQFGDFHNTTMELHLPCRDPVNHLMSMCNHRGAIFDCTNSDYRAEADRCKVGVRDRFDCRLLDVKNIDVKCYDYEDQFTGYMEYIASKLQKKRIQSKYVERASNRARNKENECIWKDPDLQKRVASYLVGNFEYWGFCNECLGSADDLLHQTV